MVKLRSKIFIKPDRADHNFAEIRLGTFGQRTDLQESTAQALFKIPDISSFRRLAKPTCSPGKFTRKRFRQNRLEFWAFLRPTRVPYAVRTFLATTIYCVPMDRTIGTPRFASFCSQ